MIITRSGTRKHQQMLKKGTARLQRIPTQNNPTQAVNRLRPDSLSTKEEGNDIVEGK